MTGTDKSKSGPGNTIVVIGAGVAGATAAYVLNREGFNVRVIEANPFIGGRCRTVERQGFRVDAGAVYLLNLYERTAALLEEAGYTGLRDWSPPAGLRDGNTLHTVRYDFLPSFLKLKSLNLADKLRLAIAGLGIILRPAPNPYEPDELAQFDKTETMEAWSLRHLGPRVHSFLVRPWIEPAFGIGVEKLSVPFLQGILKRAYRAKFRVPVGGMGDIPAAFLKNIDVTLNSPVKGIERNSDQSVTVRTDGETIEAQGIVVATPAQVTGGLLDGSIDQQSIEKMNSAPYSSMANIILGYDKNPWPNAPTDMVIPVGEGEHPLLGIILHGRKSPQNVPEGAQLVDFYFHDSATRSMSDDDLIEYAKRTVQTWLGKAPEPVFAESFRHEPALAYAPPGHYGKMKELRNAMPSNIALAGDYLAHLGIETAVVTGERAALDLVKELKQ